MPSFVTENVQTFPNGVKANLSLTDIAIINASPEAWRRFAERLDPALKGYQSSPMNNTSVEKLAFVALRNSLQDAMGSDRVRELLEGLLERTREMIGTPQYVRFRKATLHFLELARSHGLVPLPAGTLKAGNVPWLEGGRNGTAWTAPLDRKLAEICGSVVRLADEFGVNDSDVIYLRSYLYRFAAFTRFSSVESLSEEFFAAFWTFMKDKLLPTFGSTKELPTAFSRMQGLFNRAFELFYIHEKRNGNELPSVQFSSGYWLQQRKNEESVLHTSFGWWTKDHPERMLWGQALEWFVHATPRKTPQHTVTCLKKLCLYLEGLEEMMPPSPVEFSRSYISRRESSPKQTFIEYLEETGASEKQIGYMSLTMVRAFFDRWHDEFGDKSQSWTNPILDHDFDGTWPKGDLSQKTNKEILPVRIIKMMKQILTENDYAWPRTLEEDYIRWHSSEKDAFVDLWCPARAIGLFLLLTIPNSVDPNAPAG